MWDVLALVVIMAISDDVIEFAVLCVAYKVFF